MLFWPAFIWWIFLEKKNSAGCLLRTKWRRKNLHFQRHTNFLVKLHCSVFSKPSWIFLLQKNSSKHQMWYYKDLKFCAGLLYKLFLTSKYQNTNVAESQITKNYLETTGLNRSNSEKCACCRAFLNSIRFYWPSKNNPVNTEATYAKLRNTWWNSECLPQAETYCWGSACA